MFGLSSLYLVVCYTVYHPWPKYAGKNSKLFSINTPSSPHHASQPVFSTDEIWKKSAFVTNAPKVPKGSAAKYQYYNAKSDKCGSLYVGIIYLLNSCTDKIQSGKGTKYFFNESDTSQLLRATYNGDTSCSNPATSADTLGYLTCTEGGASTQHFKVVKGTFEPSDPSSGGVPSSPFAIPVLATVIIVAFEKHMPGDANLVVNLACVLLGRTSITTYCEDSWRLGRDVVTMKIDVTCDERN